MGVGGWPDADVYFQFSRKWQKEQLLLSGKPPHTSPLKTVLTVNLLSSVHVTFCLHLSRCGWVEPAAVPQQR